MTNVSQGEFPSDREVVNTRIFAVPRDSVFRAFSDPQQLAQWWGPTGFTNTFTKFDLRPGGHWEFVMHGPDGQSYPNEKRFTEVVPPERVVFEHVDLTHHFQMTMIFAEDSGKTRVTWRMRFESAAEFAQHREFIANANEQNLDRLQAHLAAVA